MFGNSFQSGQVLSLDAQGGFVPYLRRTRASSFTPASVSGLKFWGDSSAVTGSDGTAQASYADLSGLGNTLTQSTGSKQPLLKTAIQNGLNVLRFDNTDDGLLFPFTLSQPGCVFISGTIHGGGSNSFISDAAADLFFYTASGVLTVFAGSTLTTSYSPVTGTWFLAELHLNGASTAVLVNGTSVGSGAGGSGRVVVSTSSGIGTGGRPLGGDLGEIQIYDNIPSSGDLASLRSYHRSKWGY